MVALLLAVFFNHHPYSTTDLGSQRIKKGNYQNWYNKQNS